MLNTVSRFAVALTGLAALFGPALAQEGGVLSTFRPFDNGQIAFAMPSRNVECVYTPASGTPTYKPPRGEAELSCDRAEPVYYRFGMGASGPSVTIRNPAEQPCCGDDRDVLPYGATWRQAPFTCLSERQGLTCRRDDGRGFFVSRRSAEGF